MVEQLIGELLKAILIPVVFALIAYFFKYRKPSEAAFYKITEGDKNEFWKWKRKYSLFALVIMCCLAYVYSFPMYLLSKLFYSTEHIYVFSITPVRAVWLAAAILCMFATVLPIMDYFERSYWGERYDFMQHLYNSHYNWDAAKASRFISLFFGTLTFITFMLLANYHVELDEKNISYNPFLNFKTHIYPFKKVIAIKKFNEWTGERFEILFDDSSKWNSGWGLELEDNKQLLKYISEKTSLPIQIIAKKK